MRKEGNEELLFNKYSILVLQDANIMEISWTKNVNMLHTTKLHTWLKYYWIAQMIKIVNFMS